MTRTIDGFTVVRELGRGGMGVIYEARHPDLPRTVALKLILEGDAEAILRFGREAELLARVSHPNVLKIHQASLRLGITLGSKVHGKVGKTKAKRQILADGGLHTYALGVSIEHFSAPETSILGVCFL